MDSKVAEGARRIRLWATTIAMWSLCEVPAVLGFVLFAMGKQWTDPAAFYSLSVLFAAILAPAWAAEPSMVTA